jgi:hypothetical protein
MYIGGSLAEFERDGMEDFEVVKNQSVQFIPEKAKHRYRARNVIWGP